MHSSLPRVDEGSSTGEAIAELPDLLGSPEAQEREEQDNEEMERIGAEMSNVSTMQDNEKCDAAAAQREKAYKRRQLEKAFHVKLLACITEKAPNHIYGNKDPGDTDGDKSEVIFVLFYHVLLCLLIIILLLVLSLFIFLLPRSSSGARKRSRSPRGHSRSPEAR